MSAPSDEVREFLRERGCPERVVERGLEGLLASWAVTVDEVSAGYRFGLDDYRNATGTYDAVVSIGLMEHVGWKNYRGYMELVDRLLAEGRQLRDEQIAGLAFATEDAG